MRDHAKAGRRRAFSQDRGSKLEISPAMFLGGNKSWVIPFWNTEDHSGAKEAKLPRWSGDFGAIAIDRREGRFIFQVGYNAPDTVRMTSVY